MKNRIKSIIVGVITFLLVFGLGVGVYAYWAKSVQDATLGEEVNVYIGEGGLVTTELVVAGDNSKKLVPVGYARDGYVEELTYILTVQWNEVTTDYAKGHEGELTVVIKEGYHTLLNIKLSEYDKEIFLNGDAVTITITVTLTEPTTQSEYEDVANQVLTFEVEFSVNATPLNP